MLACFVMVGIATPVARAAVSPQAFERLTEQLQQAIAECRRLAEQVTPYDVVFRRDPLRPLVDAQGALVTTSGLRGGLWVQGIIWSEGHPMAVVDDELVAPGAALGPYVIQWIKPDGVVVRRQDGETLFIPLDRGLETP